MNYELYLWRDEQPEQDRIRHEAIEHRLLGEFLEIDHFLIRENNRSQENFQSSMASPNGSASICTRFFRSWAGPDRSDASKGNVARYLALYPGDTPLEKATGSASAARGWFCGCAAWLTEVAFPWETR